MGRFLNTVTKVIVTVDDSKDDRFASGGWKRLAPGDNGDTTLASKPAQPAPIGYEAMTVVDLKAEIKNRNEGREAEARIPGDGNKAELVAALEADDAAKVAGDTNTE